jgi:hypothetical protein
VGWSIEHAARSAASPHAIWRRYVDVEHWRDWSRQGVECSSINGPFEVGTKGKSKAPGLPSSVFELVAVEPDVRFVSKVKMPGAALRFEHVIEPSEHGSLITHRVGLDGPLASLYTPFLRKRIERGLGDGVDRLATMAAADG